MVLFRHSSAAILTSDSLSSHIRRNVSMAIPRNFGKSGTFLSKQNSHYRLHWWWAWQICSRFVETLLIKIPLRLVSTEFERVVSLTLNLLTIDSNGDVAAFAKMGTEPIRIFMLQPLQTPVETRLYMEGIRSKLSFDKPEILGTDAISNYITVDSLIFSSHHYFLFPATIITISV